MTINSATRDLTSSNAEATNRDSGQVQYSVLSPAAIWSAAAVIVLVGVGVAVWLLLAYGRGDQQDRNQLEAIKTAGTIVVGTGGAAALLLAARRQRTAEIALKQKDLDQAHQERAHALQERVAAETMAHQQQVAADARADSIERRITELYTKAADQLGSDKAPVRLAGLYALERLAQDNEAQRQTIVNVLCAYLRMPYQPPGVSVDGADVPTASAHQERKQELEVRLAAQRLLADHLRPGTDTKHPVKTFWKDIDLDLTDAILIDLDLSECTVSSAAFTGARFIGVAQFSGVQFTGTARFDGALFDTAVRFNGVQFNGATWFDDADFQSTARFGLAQFNGSAGFEEVHFESDVPEEVLPFFVPSEDDKERGETPLPGSDTEPPTR